MGYCSGTKVMCSIPQTHSTRLYCLSFSPSLVWVNFTVGPRVHLQILDRLYGWRIEAVNYDYYQKNRFITILFPIEIFEILGECEKLFTAVHKLLPLQSYKKGNVKDARLVPWRWSSSVTEGSGKMMMIITPYATCVHTYTHWAWRQE